MCTKWHFEGLYKCYMYGALNHVPCNYLNNCHVDIKIGSYHMSIVRNANVAMSNLSIKGHMYVVIVVPTLGHPVTYHATHGPHSLPVGVPPSLSVHVVPDARLVSPPHVQGITPTNSPHWPPCCLSIASPARGGGGAGRGTPRGVYTRCVSRAQGYFDPPFRGPLYTFPI